MNGDKFDKLVSKMTTTQLTEDTVSVTELPDEFEPKDMKAMEIAKLIP